MVDAARELVIRKEVQDWLRLHWTPGMDEAEFAEEVVDAGWMYPALSPECLGRGLPEGLAHVVTEEFTAFGAPMREVPSASALIVNLIASYGTSSDLRRQVMRGFLTGVFRLCLLYSEPGAGSDLAAVQTRADRDGESWVINGQKVWTSLAKESTHGLLVARTNWDVPKHKGITVFLLPMLQSGVQVSPIRQITGRATFNEVFFTDATVADSMRIGEVNEGWRVLQTALSLERMHMGTGNSQSREAGLELVRTSCTRLLVTANERGRANDGAIRQAIARLYALERIGVWNAVRTSGATDPKVASILKLAMSEVLHHTARIHSALLGPDSLLTGMAWPEAHHANLAAMYAFENSIGGGSDQIQRNLIGERVLGLPREPAVDRDVPFKDVRRAESIRRLGSPRGPDADRFG